MPELYPSPVPGHSSSPNLPLSHNIPHNPYTSHPIYPASNLMQMVPPTSLTNLQPGSPLNNIQNLSQSGINGYNKDNNDNNVGNSNHQSYGNSMTPTTTSMVTILGPNSGKFQYFAK